MGERVRRHDWSKTALGPIESWPRSLKSAAATVLWSPVSMVMLWGEEGVMIYNDAYSVFAGGRHPQLLGTKVREGWPEVADFNDNVMKVGLAGGTLAYRDQALTLYRTGEAEQVWMNLDYSPLPDDEGRPAGVVAIVVEVTGQKRATADLQQSEERLRLVVEAAEVGLWDVDMINDTLFWPDRVRAMFGISPGQPVTMTDFYNGLHPDDAEATTKAFLASTDPARRALYDMEYRTVGKEDGIIRWVAAKGRGVFNDEGECVRVLGTALDITARKAVEAKLRHLNETLERQVIERTQARGKTWQVSPDLLCAVNEKGHFETSNPAWQALLGWSEDEVASMSIFKFLHPDDVERTLQGFAVTRTGQPVLQFPNRYRCKDGSYRWISWVAVPDEGLVYCSGRDITAELAAKAERDRIFEISPDLFGVATFDGYLTSINPAWSVALGRTQADLLAKPFSEIIHPDDLDLTAEVVAALRAGSPMRQFQVRLLKSDGQPIPFSWSAVPDAVLESGLFYTVGRDITGDLAKAAQLEQASDALRQAQKMEAVGQLTGGIAHDFNNLLQGVVGSLDLIRRKADDAALVRRWADAGYQAAERGTKLTSQLLAFSRVQKLEVTTLAVADLVLGTRDILARTLGPSIRVRLDLEQEVDGAGLYALGDATQLEMAVLNLAINARDAMPQGGEVTLSLRTRHITKGGDPGPGEYVELAVSDTGHGMEPDVASRAFDPFFTTKGVGKGTGLGLAQVYGMVRQVGGGARIESAPGQGTTVSLLLRRAPPPGTAPAASSTARPETSPRTASVLVIDDDEDVRRFLVDALAALGYGVRAAQDGAEGLAALEESRPDLVLVDFAMPGMTGAEVVEAARQRHPDLPVIFASGFADTGAIERAIGEGATMLRKPFQISDLEAALELALNAQPEPL